MPGVDQLVENAEACWLSAFEAGPTEPPSRLLSRGDPAPDAELSDERGEARRLSEFWTHGPALVMFWRHFGCGCGVERAARLATELPAYLDAGLTIVIVGQGEPERAAAYKQKHGITVPLLSDPGAQVYRAYGVGHWQPEQLLFDAPAEYLEHPRALGRELLTARRELGRPMVDDPWRAAAEFVVDQTGTVRLGYSYQYCEDFPDPRVLTAAARLAQSASR
jgi:peroxiredoxin